MDVVQGQGLDVGEVPQGSGPERGAGGLGFVLEQSEDGLRGGIVVGVADGPIDAESPSRASVSVNRTEVRPCVGVMDHAGRHRPVGVIAPPQGHGQALLDEGDVLGRRGGPAHDRPGVQVDRERDVDEAGPGPIR